VDNFCSAQPIVDNSYLSLSLASRSERGVITRTSIWCGRGRLVAQRGGVNPRTKAISSSRLVAHSGTNRGGDYPKMAVVAPLPISQSRLFIVGRLGGGRLPVNRVIIGPQIGSSISKGGGKSPKSFLRTASADFCAREQVFTSLGSATCAPEGGVIPRTTQLSVGSSRYRRGGKSPNARKPQNLYLRSRSLAVCMRVKGGNSPHAQATGEHYAVQTWGGWVLMRQVMRNSVQLELDGTFERHRALCRNPSIPTSRRASERLLTSSGRVTVTEGASFRR
jgi:hypothetical protein